jgi:pyruvate formate lyase activating enzyme
MKEEISVDFSKVIPVSTVDWYGRSSCVVFFNKCPMKCKFCQNHKLLKDTNIVNVDIVKREIEYSMDFVSAVVFSGGEPTLQEKALDHLIRFSRDNGLRVGIQTSGYYPHVLKKLTDDKLLDKVFLDIKAYPLNADKYKAVTGVDNANLKVVESFNIINTSYVTSEIRTTVFRSFIGEVYEIAGFLKMNNYRGVYTLQTGLPGNSPTEEIRKEKPMKSVEMDNLAKKLASETGICVKYS